MNEYLSQTIFAIRVRTHAVTRKSPFYLLYGVEPHLPGDTSPPRESMEPLDLLEINEKKKVFTIRELEALGQDRAASYFRSLDQATKMSNDRLPR